MKKLIKNVILLFLIVGIILIQLNVIYERKVNDYEDIDKFYTIPSEIMISNIGSSHGVRSFNYENLRDKYVCFNFAQSSQSLSYDYRVIQNYKNNLAEGGIMLIPISYFSFYGETEVKEVNFISKNQRYYRILDNKYIKEYSLLNDLKYNYLRVITAREELFTRLLGHKILPEDVWNKSSLEIDVAQDAREAYQRHVTDRKMIRNEEEIQALYEIINFCEEHSIIPVMITTPYMTEYNELVTKDFLSDFKGIIKKVQEDTDVIYYDYADDKRFLGKDELFINSDHLNRKGALIFTDIISEEIIEPMMGVK